MPAPRGIKIVEYRRVRITALCQLKRIYSSKMQHPADAESVKIVASVFSIDVRRLADRTDRI